MISELRSYIKGEIQLIDSDLKENKSAFYDADIGETILEDTYQIEINNIQNTLREAYYEQTVDVVISIFGVTYRDEIAKYDELLDKAICIKDNIINLTNLSKAGSITNMEAGAINASKLDSNDNAFKIDINLTALNTYTRG